VTPGDAAPRDGWTGRSVSSAHVFHDLQINLSCSALLGETVVTSATLTLGTIEQSALRLQHSSGSVDCSRMLVKFSNTDCRRS
jgi:hypothetical protein